METAAKYVPSAMNAPAYEPPSERPIPAWQKILREAKATAEAEGVDLDQALTAALVWELKSLS